MADPVRWLSDPSRAPEGAAELLKTAAPAPPLPPAALLKAVQVAAHLSTTKASLGAGALIAKWGWIAAGTTAAAVATASVGPWDPPNAADQALVSEERHDDPVVRPEPPKDRIDDAREAVYQIEDLEPIAEDPVNRSVAPDPVPRSRLGEETALADRARSLVAVDPEGALSLTRDYERLFPDGQLEGAMGVIAAEALVALGRGAEAQQRANAAIEAEPQGIYSERLRKLRDH